MLEAVPEPVLEPALGVTLSNMSSSSICNTDSSCFIVDFTASNLGLTGPNNNYDDESKDNKNGDQETVPNSAFKFGDSAFEASMLMPQLLLPPSLVKLQLLSSASSSDKNNDKEKLAHYEPLDLPITNAAFSLVNCKPGHLTLKPDYESLFMLFPLLAAELPISGD